MKQADERNQKIGLMVFSGIFFVVYLLFIFNIGGNFFHYYYTQAGALWNVAAPISAGVHYWFLWYKFRDVDNPLGAKLTPQAIYLFFWFALNVFLFAGWEFPLPR